MYFSALMCLTKILNVLPLLLLSPLLKLCHGWHPDTSTKLINNLNKIPSITFKGNNSFPDHFTVLYQDDGTILLGGRNRVYNLSLFDFTERKDSTLYWPSSEAHGQLCNLKGKTEDDCQNYIRILFYTAPGKFLICGTNSYKPLCRMLQQKNEKVILEKEMEGIGLCPYDPEHNSTAVYSNGHLFSATVADFSATDPLIYREPLRTELSDLRQLNAPNFVSSLTYGDYIYFFFRETAVEYMNCGKVIYSRVARVCKHERGGPHQSRDRWTTFLKSRLNCSVPGEYPFYFDEIRPFKHQESINTNWLPVPDSKVPTPRPGECVQDSRVLADKNVNFIKTHPLMERAVPSLYGQPLFIRVSLNYRLTAITVDPQVRTINDDTFDVIYVGTDDGRILKIVNIPSEDSAKAVVISENEVFPKNVPVKQLKIAPGYGKVVAISQREAKLVTINHCTSLSRCSDCIELRDPHCAWDSLKGACVSVDAITSFRYLIQDVRHGNSSKCRIQPIDKLIPKKEYNTNSIDTNSLEEDKESSDSLLRLDEDPTDCNGVDGDRAIGCASQSKLTLYTSEYLHIIHPNPPFIEQHNHLDRLTVNQNSFLAPRTKTVNLDVLNVSTDSLPPKKDNLGSLKNLNITNEGTLQKIKKTYI
ncbi:hypothetical protein NQ317_000907 [Molorchus minor]|uniref:Sema domain-containing protein n=1 Tax=Molorchus minor TaxID=1323400 RepID=A0ABQ9JZY5_9CUCU|nr:hypothetical protein NQ317_000907 [Molorchus minor]